MTYAATGPLGPEFELFLYASIDGDKDVMPLSVLSALARQNIDPWLEAAALARVPRETAMRRLATLIATQPDRPTNYSAAQKIAERLIGLLPRTAGSNIPPSNAPVVESHIHTQALASIIFCLVLVVFSIGVQSIIANLDPPARAMVTHEAPPDTISPPIGR